MKLQIPTLWQHAINRIRNHRVAIAAFWILLIYAIMGLFVLLGLMPEGWSDSLGKSYQAPSDSTFAHWFGTDFLGRSVLYRTLYGVKIALIVGLSSTLISIPIGVVLGALAGYFGRWVDDLIVWFYTTLSSIPYILLVLVIALVLGKGLAVVCVAIGLTSWVGLCRVIRGEFMKHKSREYVLAAHSLGVSHAGRIFKHILPNVFHQVIISFSLQFPSAIKAEVILAFLGLSGAQSWGVMISEARVELIRDPSVWWTGAAATIAMFFLVLAFNIFGDALRDALDPKLRAENPT